MELVKINNGLPVTSTLTIADGLQVEHKAIIQLVRKHQADLEEFGRVTFEMLPFETAGGMQTKEIAELNERQATLIMTYSKNTEIARTFKKRLVKVFYEMATAVQRPSNVRPEIEAAEIFSKFNDVGKLIGFDVNMAAFSANNATRKIININVLELMGVTKLIAPTQVADLNPGELGRFMNPIRNSVQVNEMLVQLGYQVRTGVSKCPYQATEKGLKFSRLNDVPRLHTEGTAQQLRWFPSILDEADVQWATGIITMKEAA
jgi:phage regulator Rha-like protein